MRKLLMITLAFVTMQIGMAQNTEVVTATNQITNNTAATVVESVNKITKNTANTVVETANKLASNSNVGNVVTNQVTAVVDTVKSQVIGVIDTTAVGVSNTERLVDKYSGKFGAVIQSLAKSLMVPIEHVYKVLVRRQIAEGIAGMIPLVALIFTLTWFFREFKQSGWAETSFYSEEWEGKDKAEKRAAWSKTQWNRHSVLSLVAAVMNVILIIVALNTTSTSLIQLINPEYGAIKDVIELVRGLK